MRFLKRHEPSSLAQLLWALVFVVLAIKLGRLAFKFYLDYGFRPLRDSWLLRGLLVALACYVASRLKVLSSARFRRFRPVLIAVPAIVLVAGKLVLAIVARQPEPAYGWLVKMAEEGARAGRVLFNAIRADVLFLSSFALVAHVLTWLTPERLRPRLHKAIGAVVAFLFAFSGLELAQYCKTGVPATGQLLGFFVTNARGIAPMLLSQIDQVTIPAMILPVVIGFAISRLTFERLVAVAPTPRWTAAGLATLILASALIRLTGIDHQFDQFSGDTFLAMRDLAPWRSNGQVEARRRATRMPLIFDTRRAVLRPRGAPPTKNVIIIMLESTRAISTSLYDPKLDTTPFMVEFAKRGAVVSTMYANVPRTNAAWVSTIDGVYFAGDREIENLVKGKQQTLASLPTLLAPLGYSSAFFTSTRLSFMYDADLVRSMGFGFLQDCDTLPREGFEEVSYTGYEDRMVLQPSLSWVRQQAEAKRPFVLMWMTNVGHYPFTPPSTWPRRSFVAGDETHDHYLNSLSYVDSIVREFIEGLDKLGVLESSIVLVLGDHGESMSEHGPRIHSLVIYDVTLHVPSVLYAPGQIPPGSRILGLRQQIDVLPTFLDLLGLDIERATLPGIPLTKPAPADRALYFGGEEGAQFLAVRKGDLKFIYTYERSPTEVYAINRDPDERHDIASTLDPRLIEDTETDMLVWQERVSLATAARPAP